MHCQWGGKLQNFPFPLGFRHPAGEGPSHSHINMHRKIGEDRACGSGDILSDRQTDRQTDTILRHHSRGRSNKNGGDACFVPVHDRKQHKNLRRFPTVCVSLDLTLAFQERLVTCYENIQNNAKHTHTHTFNLFNKWSSNLSKAASRPHIDGSFAFAMLGQCAPHLIHASLGPLESTSQAASRSVQPFCTSHCRFSITVSTVVLNCCKGDKPSQWEYPIFGSL